MMNEDEILAEYWNHDRRAIKKFKATYKDPEKLQTYRNRWNRRKETYESKVNLLTDLLDLVDRKLKEAKSDIG